MITYAIWVWLAQWCEGGHFTLLPNVLKIIYGPAATQLYGIAFSYMGFCSLLMLGLLATPLGHEYILFWGIGGLMSCVSLVMLLTVFSQDRYIAIAARHGLI